MPPSEPTPQDVAAVQQHIDGNQPVAQPQAPPVQAPPAPQPPAPQQPQAPEPQAPQPQMQPDAPTPQPAPTQQTGDPFASLFATEPTAPAQPQTPPTQPTEPTQPQTPPTQAPAEPAQPATPPQQQPQAPEQGQQASTTPEPPATQPQTTDDYQSFEDYLNDALKGVPSAPELPDPEKIDPNDPQAIKSFFDGLVNTAVERSNAQFARQNAIQGKERQLWEGAFTKYPTLRSNKKARDIVHNLRMGYFQRNIAITPLQAANILLESTSQSYRQGVADNQVVTTIENVQPQGGGSAAPVPTTVDKDEALLRLQTGGEAALADMLDVEVKAGRL